MAHKMLSRLRLNHAFKGYNTPDECLEFRTDDIAYISDDEKTGISCFMPLDGDHGRCLKVLNHTNREFALLCIDHKLLNGLEGGVADCGVFDDRTFWLTEFKCNAQGNSDGAVKDTYNTAIAQLKHTVKVFKEREDAIGVDFVSTSNLRCNIVTAHAFPSASALEMELAVGFATEMFGLTLDFKRSIKF